MAPNDSSSSSQKSSGKNVFTVRTNKHGVKHVCFAESSQTAEERATQATSGLQAESRPGSSGSSGSSNSNTTMNTASENPFATPDRSRRSSQSATVGSSPAASEQMNADAGQRPKPSASEQERMRRLQTNGLPFFARSFLRYHQAQKNYEKMKKNKAESEKDK